MWKFGSLWKLGDSQYCQRDIGKIALLTGFEACPQPNLASKAFLELWEGLKIAMPESQAKRVSDPMDWANWAGSYRIQNDSHTAFDWAQRDTAQKHTWSSYCFGCKLLIFLSKICLESSVEWRALEHCLMSRNIVISFKALSSIPQHQNHKSSHRFTLKHMFC